MLQVSEYLPSEDFTVTVHVPLATALTLPALTVATLLSEDDQDTVLPSVFVTVSAESFPTLVSMTSDSLM